MLITLVHSAGWLLRIIKFILRENSRKVTATIHYST